ncbi:tRNA (guanosine(46)-N7)-methyltransferase TrmB [Wolinella succinogenes]|uniref:tRNA (guanosine(46)-N7)-methyltransferase TrmB n=1 Tax=Wolinella succinogenes TaxID=844 RepID=UPI0024098CD2|nr:tRNA (guanosine(46)-N7)-methyltransferase TrmB [Wolinella succinogenes]
MPHFIASSFTHPDYPFEEEGYCFSDSLSNLLHPHEELVRVEVEGKEFFLRIKHRLKENDFIIRFDKSTRVSPVGIIKKALRIFAQKSQAQILSDNLSEEDSIRQKRLTPFLKTPEFFMHEVHQGQYWVEIGFGSGRHLLHQAKAHPEKRFIGLEIHTPSIEQVLRRLELEEISNVSIVSYDARVFLELLPSNAIERLFVHFPVPWDKKPHRRIFSRAFLNEAIRTLGVGGILELRTDSEDYFLFAKELLLELNRVHFSIRKNFDAPISSKYEDRWRKQNKNIYDLLLHNDQHSPDPLRSSDFSFKPLKRCGVAELRREIREGWFASIERLYRSKDGKSMAIRSSFGDFAYPEKKYLWIKGEGARYFGSPPIPSLANHQAHKLLEEWLS